MSLDPRRMRILLAVARFGGVLAAADELRISPSAVSQQLAKLEQEAGTSLTDRTPRGTVLTPAGVLVAEAAEEIERVISVAEARLTEAGTDVEGHVRVGAFASFVRAVVAPNLPGWRARFPGLELDIREYNRVEAMRLLRRGEIDAAVVELDAEHKQGQVLPAGIVEDPLFDEPWRLVVPVGTPGASTGLDLSRLSLPWLGTADSIAISDAILRIKKAAGWPQSSIHHYEETLTALALVAAGQGATVLPMLALHGLHYDGIETLEIPGLGTRRIVVRRLARKKAGRTPVETTVDLLREAVRALAEAEAAHRA